VEEISDSMRRAQTDESTIRLGDFNARVGRDLHKYTWCRPEIRWVNGYSVISA